MPMGTAVFLDTSIQIARKVHSPALKKKIEQRIDQYDLTTTGQIVRQEFKRRLLGEAKYLLGVLNDRDSFIEAYHHVARLPVNYPRQRRQKNTCLQLLGLGSAINAKNDADRTERFRLKLHYLLTLGMDRFDESVGVVKDSVGCTAPSCRLELRSRRRDTKCPTTNAARPRQEAAASWSF